MKRLSVWVKGQEEPLDFVRDDMREAVQKWASALTSADHETLVVEICGTHFRLRIL